MGGKGSVPSPPPSNWSSIAELQMQQQFSDMQLQSQLMILQLQQDYEESFNQILEESVLPPAPEITEYDIDWTDKIAEMEQIAYDEISELTEVGVAGGTIITSPLVWEEEPTVISPLLGGS